MPIFGSSLSGRTATKKYNGTPTRRFHAFVASNPFSEAYEIPDAELREILLDNANLMQFVYRFLRQVMFGEETTR